MEGGALLTFPEDEDSVFGLGFDANAAGTITADGAGTVIDARNALFSVGHAPGSSGNLTLTGGAELLLTRHTYIGDFGTGNVTLRSGSQLMVDFGFGDDGAFSIGDNGGSIGDLSVNDPGTFALIDTAIVIGRARRSNGAMDVGGQATVVLSQAGSIGVFGTGQLYMDTGAQVTILGGTNGAKTSTWYVGDGDSGNGTIQAVGPGTTFTVGDNSILYIGNSGKGLVAASGGAAVQTDTLIVGEEKGSKGAITIDSGASWTTGSGSVIFLGVNGLASLAVSNSATLLIPGKLVSSQMATVTVYKTAQVAIGSGGFGPPGTVRVSAGGEFVARGTVNAQVVVAAGGLFIAGGDPGKLTINGDLTMEPGSVTEIDLGGSAPGKNAGQLVVTGSIVLGGTLNVPLVAGFDPTAAQALQGHHRPERQWELRCSDRRQRHLRSQSDRHQADDHAGHAHGHRQSGGRGYGHALLLRHLYARHWICL